ncbi:IS1 transposase [compost metagenome]
MFKTSLLNCRYCTNPCIRKGIRNTIQQYYCKQCCKYQRAAYKNHFVDEIDRKNIVQLNNEGMGIRSIGRYLEMSPANVVRTIIHLQALVSKPVLKNVHQHYEVDELCTFIGNKTNRIWIAYAYCRATKSVSDFVIGTRSKMTLEPLVNRLLQSSPNMIYTDKHQTYTTLIPDSIHSTKYRGTNHIERKNLTLRTHLKRLSRRTICFSKSTTMLYACLMIYFFG